MSCVQALRKSRQLQLRSCQRLAGRGDRNSRDSKAIPREESASRDWWCRRLASERFEEGERELLSIEGLLSQRGDRFFNLKGSQLLALPIRGLAAPWSRPAASTCH